MTAISSSDAERMGQPVLADDGSLAGYGLPELPMRAPPLGTRKLYSLERAKKEIDEYGSEALSEARKRLAALIEKRAPIEQLQDAQQIVDYLRHSRGPKFQVAILIHCAHPKIEVIYSKDQSPFERVYELSMALATGIYAQSGIKVRAAMAALQTRVGTEEQEAEWNALADLFLRNTTQQNDEHWQLGRIQKLVDNYAQAALRNYGGDPRAAAQAMQDAKVDAAQRIRFGDIDLIKDI